MDKKKKKIKVFWPKWEKKTGFTKTNKIDKSTILVNGLLITCIMLSIASGFVDIVCYSGLSKSYLHIGTLPIAAAILYTIISIGLTSGKFWCAMKIGMLKELKTRLKASMKTWYHNITRALIPWQIAHKALICISLITALSLSVNSIGMGIRTMQHNIDSMTTDAATLIELNQSVNSGVKSKREAAKSTITSKVTAKDDAKQEVDRYYSRLVQYQEEYFALSDEDKNGDQGTAIINKIVKEIPGATRNNALYFTKADLQKSIQNVATKNEAIDNSSIYEEAVEYDQSQIELTLSAIADKEYRTPDGTLISFTNDDGSLVNVQLAISRLQNGIMAWQNDTGDVGESSKVFTLVATYIHADESAGGMGTGEKLLVLFIFITGIIQEFLIALCTPAATISRATLGSVSHYCEWKDKNEKESFLQDVYDQYLGDGVISQEEHDIKYAKSISICQRTRQDMFDEFGKKQIEVDPLEGIPEAVERVEGALND